jgi:hypothetical protein
MSWIFGKRFRRHGDKRQKQPTGAESAGCGVVYIEGIEKSSSTAITESVVSFEAAAGSAQVCSRLFLKASSGR